MKRVYAVLSMFLMVMASFFSSCESKYKTGAYPNVRSEDGGGVGNGLQRPRLLAAQFGSETVSVGKDLTLSVDVASSGSDIEKVQVKLAPLSDPTMAQSIQLTKESETSYTASITIDSSKFSDNVYSPVEIVIQDKAQLSAIYFFNAEINPRFYVERTDGKSAVTAVAIPRVLVDVGNPMVVISNPGASSTVSGKITIAANASDFSAIQKLEVFLDGQSIGYEKNASNIVLEYDTEKGFDGKKTIEAEATDAFGNKGRALIQITVDNVPELAFDAGHPLTRKGQPFSHHYAGEILTVHFDVPNQYDSSMLTVHKDGRIMMTPYTGYTGVDSGCGAHYTQVQSFGEGSYLKMKKRDGGLTDVQLPLTDNTEVRSVLLYDYTRDGYKDLLVMQGVPNAEILLFEADNTTNFTHFKPFVVVDRKDVFGGANCSPHALVKVGSVDLGILGFCEGGADSPTGYRLFVREAKNSTLDPPQEMWTVGSLYDGGVWGIISGVGKFVLIDRLGKIVVMYHNWQEGFGNWIRQDIEARYNPSYYPVPFRGEVLGGGHILWYAKQYLKTDLSQMVNHDIRMGCSAADPVEFKTMTIPVFSSETPFYFKQKIWKGAYQIEATKALVDGKEVDVVNLYSLTVKRDTSGVLTKHLYQIGPIYPHDMERTDVKVGSDGQELELRLGGEKFLERGNSEFRLNDVLDFDKDGKTDLIMAEIAGTELSGKVVHHYRFSKNSNTWDGVEFFGLQRADDGSARIKIADLNRDGFWDEVICRKNSSNVNEGPDVGFYLNTGDNDRMILSNYTSISATGKMDCQSLWIQDVDYDNDLDLIYGTVDDKGNMLGVFMKRNIGSPYFPRFDDAAAQELLVGGTKFNLNNYALATDDDASYWLVPFFVGSKKYPELLFLDLYSRILRFANKNKPN